MLSLSKHKQTLLIVAQLLRCHTFLPRTQPSLTSGVVSAVPSCACRPQCAGWLHCSPLKHVLGLGRHSSLRTHPAPWARCHVSHCWQHRKGEAGRCEHYNQQPVCVPMQDEVPRCTSHVKFSKITIMVKGGCKVPYSLE